MTTHPVHSMPEQRYEVTPLELFFDLVFRVRGADTLAKYQTGTSATKYPVELSKIGEHIRKRRLDLGLLQVEIAVHIGVTESTVWKWEHGTDSSS